MKNKIAFWSIFSLFLVFGISCTKTTSSINPTLAEKPPMGFNSYDSYLIYLNQETSVQLIDIMAEKYLPFGYEYFVIDAGWYFEYDVDPVTRLPKEIPYKIEVPSNLDEYGLPEPSKVYFSNGMKALADYSHSKGLKFGLHLMRGVYRQALEGDFVVKGTDIPLRSIVDTTSVCAWSNLCYGVDMSKPGAQQYYESLINKLASWGVDFIKIDDITGFPDEVDAVVNAIENCGRDIVLSLSPGSDSKLEYLPCYEKSNLLRITKDIWDNQKSIDNGFAAMQKYQGRGCPGFWPDLDMIALGPLEVNDVNKNLGATGHGPRYCLLDNDQALSLITQRAIFASPLIIGGDLLTMDSFTYNVLTNEDMIACNQNGVTGFQVYDDDGVEIYKATKREKVTDGWLAIFNRNDEQISTTLSKSDFGFFFERKELSKVMSWSDYSFRNIWNPEEYILKDSIDFTIAANGVVFLEYIEL